MVRQHLERNVAFYGPHKGLILFRKHAMQYLKLQHLPRATRTKIILQEECRRISYPCWTKPLLGWDKRSPAT